MLPKLHPIWSLSQICYKEAYGSSKSREDMYMVHIHGSPGIKPSMVPYEKQEHALLALCLRNARFLDASGSICSSINQVGHACFERCHGRRLGSHDRWLNGMRNGTRVGCARKCRWDTRVIVGGRELRSCWLLIFLRHRYIRGGRRPLDCFAQKLCKPPPISSCRK